MDTEQIEQSEQKEAIQRRNAYIMGLRSLATFLETHPTLPCPYTGQSANAFVYTKPDLATIARSNDVKWRKGVSGGYFYLAIDFVGGHSYEVNVDREQVCRKVVTGKRLQPAVAEHEIEEYEWICDEPLLKG